MKIGRWMLAALLTAAMTTGVWAQSTTSDKAKRGEEVSRKFREVDMLNMLIPVAMTKDQIRAILPAVEKARAHEKKIRDLEDDDMLKMDAKLTKAIQASIDGGAVPSKDLITEIFQLNRAMSLRRQVAVNEMIDMIYPALDKNLDAGQKKVMANSLDPKSYDKSINTEGMTDETKIRFYVRIILLDPATYGLLVRLSK